MDYPIKDPRLAGTPAVRVEGILGGAKVVIDGQPAPKGQRRGTFSLPREEGGEAVVKFLPSMTRLAPSVEVDGVKIDVAPKLAAGWFVLIFLPLVLVPIGGLIGGACGGAAAGINQIIARAQLSVALKILLMLGMFAVAVGMMLLLGTLFTAAVG